MLAEKTTVTTNFCGDVILPFQHAQNPLKKVLHTSKMVYNLVSIGRLAKNGIESHLRRREIRLILGSNSILIGSAIRDLGSGMIILPDPESQHLEEQTLVTRNAQSTT